MLKVQHGAHTADQTFVFGLFKWRILKKELTSGHDFSLRYQKALKCWIPALRRYMGLYPIIIGYDLVYQGTGNLL